MVFDVVIIQQTSSSIILPLSCSELSYVFILFYTRINGLTRKVLFVDDDVAILNNAFWYIIPFGFRPFSIVNLNYQNKQSVQTYKVWFENLSILVCCLFILTFCFITFIPIHWPFKYFGQKVGQFFIVLCW